MTCSRDGEGEAIDSSPLLLSFLSDHSLHFPKRGWDSSKSPPAFSVSSGTQTQIPTHGDSLPLNLFPQHPDQSPERDCDPGAILAIHHRHPHPHVYLPLYPVPWGLGRELEVLWWRGRQGPGVGDMVKLGAWFGPEQPVLFSVVLRALFRHSDPKRFQNIFTTIFTLFTLLTLDDWSLIYLDNRDQGGTGPRQGGGQGAGWVDRSWGLSYPICKAGLLTLAGRDEVRAGKELPAPTIPSLPGAWYIIPILMIYIIIQYFIFLK